MQAGLVSTIIPVHNRPTMLRDAVLSVLQQVYRPIEIIIIDDGSTDSTLDVANSLAEEHGEIRVLSHSNAGPGPAREAGRQIANGEFIQYLDSDDLLLPEKFQQQVLGLNENPHCGISYCKTSVQTLANTSQAEHVILDAWKRTGERIETLFPSMFAGRWWGTSTPLYRRSLTDLGGAWGAMINEEDWEYDCRLATINPHLHYVSQTLSTERFHDSERLSKLANLDPNKLRSRAKAHTKVVSYATSAGFDCANKEFVILLKSVFFVARQCGAAGLADHSKALFKLAKEHLLESGSHRFQLYTYRIAVMFLGWEKAGKLSVYLDSLRS